MAKILISAGEASGDIHAAAVTAAIKKLDSKAEVFWYGRRRSAQGRRRGAVGH